MLPPDVTIGRLRRVPPGFSPRRAATRREYRYTIWNGPRSPLRERYALGVREPLDAPAMHAAAQLLVGRHDFASFQTQGTERESTVRTVYELSVSRGEGAQTDLVTLEIEANGFLYNMVRAIVGTLVKVGGGRKPLAWPREVLEARDRRVAGVNAPFHGL